MAPKNDCWAHLLSESFEEGLWSSGDVFLRGEQTHPFEEPEWKWKVLSCARLFTTPWTIAYQALPSLGFSRLEYWSGLDNIKFYLLTQYAIKLVYQSLREYTHTHPSKNIFEQQGKKTLDFKETLFILLHKQNVIGYSFTSLMAKLEIETWGKAHSSECSRCALIHNQGLKWLRV